MKKVLFPIALITLLSVLIYSCSSDEDDSAPPSVIQTPEPETPAPTQYTLSVSAGEGGSVSTEGGIYDEGTSVTITANPNDGYVFTGWSDGSTNSEISLTLNSNISLSASFEIQSTTIQLDQHLISQPSSVEFNEIQWILFT